MKNRIQWLWLLEGLELMAVTASYTIPSYDPGLEGEIGVEFRTAGRVSFSFRSPGRG